MTVLANLSRSVASLFRTRNKLTRRPNRRRRLALAEVLEDRTLLAGLVMDESVFDLDLFEQNIRDFYVDNSVGFGYAINQGGVNAASDGWGDARRGFAGTAIGQVDFTEDTRMGLASVSKTINATGTLKLLQDTPGVSLNSSISPYLPAAWVQHSSIASITFRDLLTHRSGITTGSGGHNQLQQMVSDGINLVNGDPTIQHGFFYTNANFGMLRVLTPYLLGVGDDADDAANPAEFIGNTHVNYILNNVLGPMGISNTNPGPPAADQVLNYPFPGDGPPITYSFNAAGVGAGGWWLSADELALFLHGLRTNDNVLSPATRELMRNGFLGWMNPADGYTYSQGMFGTYYSHGGDTTNLNTGIIDFPNGVQAALLINSETTGAPYQVTALKNAFEDAWTELVYDGYSLADVANLANLISSADDTFTVRTNPTDPAFIDIIHQATSIFGSTFTVATITRRADTLQKLTINGLSGNDTFLIQALPQNLELVINGGSGSDTVLVDSNAAGSGGLDQFAPGTLTFNGGPIFNDGFNELTINDTNQGVGATYSVTDVQVTRSGAGTYNYHNVDLLTLFAGNGSDEIWVESSHAGTFTTINAQGGKDTIIIGGAHIDDVLGDVNVVGGFGFDTVRFSDIFSRTGHDYEVNSDETVIDGTVTITYDVEILELYTGGGDDTITINSLDADQTLDITGGTGADDVTINLLSSPLVTSVLGKVDVHGGSGTGDTLTINDATHFQSSDYTITGSTVARADVQPIGYDGVEQLSVFGGVSPSNYYIDSTSIPTTVWGNIQGDTFHVGANFVGDPDLNDIAAPLTIQGGENVGGEDTVFLNDTLGSNGAYVIQNELVTGNNFAAISLIDIDHAVLNASNLGVIVHVENAAGDTRYTVNGGFGNNTYHLAFGSKNLSNFNNPLIINGGLNDDHLILYDQSAPFNPTYTVTANSVDRIGFGEFSPFFPQIGVTFSSMSEVELNLNGGINTVNVQSTNPDTEYIFHGSGWDDTLNLNRHLDDAMDASISIDGTEISSTNIDISYHQFGQLNVNLGPENTTVRIHDLVTDVDLNLGLGDDRVLVTPATGNLSNINFAIFVDGQGGHDQLVLHDQENPSAATYTITPDSVNRFFFGPLFGGEPGVRFVDLDEMRLLMGAHDDIANVNGTSPGTHYDLRGRRGDDTFNINVPPSSPVTLRGGLGSDTARIFGTRGDDEVSVSAGPGTADVNLVSIETASFDGFAGTDVLVYQGLPGVDEQVEVRASTTANQGTLRIVEVLDLLFQNTELIDLLANPSDADTAAFVGTDQDDRFEIDLSAAGTNADPVLRLVDPDSLDVLLSLRDYRNFGTLQVRGEDGADLFNVYALPAGPGTGRNLSIDGGSPSGPGNPKDELNVYREFKPPPKPGPNPGNQSEGSIEVLYDLYEFLIDFWDIEKVKVLSNNAGG